MEGHSSGLAGAQNQTGPSSPVRGLQTEPQARAAEDSEVPSGPVQPSAAGGCCEGKV